MCQAITVNDLQIKRQKMIETCAKALWQFNECGPYGTSQPRYPYDPVEYEPQAAAMLHAINFGDPDA
jgi:hypothetical protein